MPLPLLELRMRGKGQKLVPGVGLVVSTLKLVSIDVQVHALKQFEQPIPIRAELTYEDGLDVRGLHNEPPLTGDTNAFLLEGAVTFRLRINSRAKVTSDQHQKKRFRIRISLGRVNSPTIQAHTTAFKIMTRIDRPLAAQKDAVDGLLQFGSQFGGTPEEAEWECVQRLVDQHAAVLKALKEKNERILDSLRELRAKLVL